MRNISPVLILTLTLIFGSIGMEASEKSLDCMLLDINTDAAKAMTPDSVARIDYRLNPRWLDLLLTKRLDVNDTNVEYPKFVAFCLDIYRWAERTFNTYDQRYVTGTGKHGKVRLVSDNWIDSYYFRVPAGVPLVMASKPYTNIGIAANYSILSASYSVDINSLFTGEKSKYRKMQFAFTCARLYGEGFFWKNNGSTRIRTVETESPHRVDHIDFEGVQFTSVGLLGLYIFNSRKFSLAAAYNLSNYQLRSDGSWLMGLSATFNQSDFDFSHLPEDIKDKTEFPFEKYKLGYNSFNVIGGYSYNWVLNRHWLFNATALPGLGLSHTFQDSTMGNRSLLSMTGRGQASLTYTNRQFFIATAVTFHGNIILTRDVRTMTGVGNMQLSTGVRF